MHVFRGVWGNLGVCTWIWMCVFMCTLRLPAPLRKMYRKAVQRDAKRTIVPLNAQTGALGSYVCVRVCASVCEGVHVCDM